ncbi:unnamed protein product [Coregonus sp. 'balchen']|nr:unnamed protein product [Coregonus sp. 'balchen']
MGISRQTIKPSPRRASSVSRAGTPHTPRHARLNAGQTRTATPIRTVQIRPMPTRTTPTHTHRPQTHGAQTFAAHTHLMPPHTAGRSFGDSVGDLSSASTLDPLPSAGPLARPRTLLRQQSLQQPLIHQPVPSLLLTHLPPTSSQSLGQIHQVPPPGPGQPGGSGGSGGSGGGGGGTQRGPRGVRGSLAGTGASRYRGGGGGRGGGGRGNPGSWDHMMGQLKNRGLDAKSFLDDNILI